VGASKTNMKIKSLYLDSADAGALRRSRRLASLVVGGALWLAACSAPLGIAEVNPADGSVDETTALTITGSGFDAATQVQLVSDELTITLVGVTIVDDETLQVAVPAGTPRGEYDVVLTGVEGSVTLPKAFSALDHVRVVAIDVGQGDATLVVGPTGRSALIDVGDDEEVDSAGVASLLSVRSALDQEGIFAPTFFFTSHFHDDHVGNLQDFLRGPDNAQGTLDDRVPTEGIFDRGDPLAGGGFTEDFYRQVTLGLRTTATLGQVFDLGGGVTLRAVAVDGFIEGVATPINIDRSDENQRTLVLLLEAPRRAGFAPFKMLFNGDLSGGGLGTVDVESSLGQAVGEVDAIRLAHHGSETSTSVGFLQATSPTVTVLSIGEDNPFCHPDTVTLGRLSTNASQATTFLTSGGILTDFLNTQCCTCRATQIQLDATPAQEVVVNGDITFDVSLFSQFFTVNGQQF
jgi:beta-lactamase superfamily II metal-dependent hydrolase